MSERFHVNCDLGLGNVVLSGPEAHHLATVCRLRPGDALCLFNGDGREYPALVSAISRREVTVQVQAVAEVSRESPNEVHVAAPLPRGDRAQFLVEKLTELGVSVLWVISPRRAVVQPREAKRDKLQRYVIEASKQCGRNVLMRVEIVTDWTEFVGDATLPTDRLLAHPRQEGAAETDWQQVRRTPIVAAVGPEGGFTEEEVAQAIEAGWRTIDLGPRILRVETAALFLASRLV